MINYRVNTDHKWVNIPNHTLGVYNYWDCIATIRLWLELNLSMQDMGQLTHYKETYWPLIAPVMAMAKRGILVDTWNLRLTKDKVAQEIKDTEKVIRDVDKDINLNSPDQRAKLLYGTLGLKCGKKTDGGKPSTDVYALDWILRNLRKKDQEAVPVLHAIFHRSRLNTIASRYLKLNYDSDHRIYPDIKLGTVETLRFAYASPAIQQIPKEVRHIFRPNPGNVFVAADYSQLEARILAILSDDRSSLEVFARGEDVHTQNAMDLFGKETIKTEERNYAKSFLYKISYGGKADSLKYKTYCPCRKCEDKVPQLLALTDERKRETEEAWFKKHQAVVDWRDTVVQGVYKHRTYTTPFGYKRHFAAPPRTHLPEIYNFPMQATAAGLVNERFITLHNSGLVPAIQMHDEIIVEAPKRRAVEVGERMKEIMEKPVRQMDNHIFPVDLKWGENWRDLEELEV